MIDEAPTVVSVNISGGGIPKHPISVGEVTTQGLVGDAHDHEKHNTLAQAISLLDVEDIADLAAEGFDVYPGATGENLTVRGLDADTLAVGDRLRLSGGIELQITKIRKPCYVLDAISPELKHAISGRCGCYAMVLSGGRVRAGATIHREHAIAQG